MNNRTSALAALLLLGAVIFIGMKASGQEAAEVSEMSDPLPIFYSGRGLLDRLCEDY